MPAILCPHAPDCEYATDAEATVGEAIQLLEMHEKAKHRTDFTAGSSSSSKVDRVRRPTVVGGGSSEDWNYFETRWDEYSAATKLSGSDKVLQLLECCDEQLRRDLTRAAGGTLSAKSETDVLQAIRRLAVREENTMVARFTLNQMVQETDEPVRNFGARIKGQANVCGYNIECSGCQNVVSYTDEILRDVLVRGLADTEIQLGLLGDKNQDMTLEEMYKYVESKESGKRSVDKLVQTLGASSMRNSAYSRVKSNNPKDSLTFKKIQTNLDEACSYCGKKGHGKSATSTIRKNACPAYGKKCMGCEKINHFKAMCRTGVSSSVVDQESGAVYDQLCSSRSSVIPVCGIKSTIDGTPLVLAHHLFDNLNECWRRGSSQPQPYVDLHVTASRQDYESLGFKHVAKDVRNTRLKVMADTGCQSCVAGLKAISQLGIGIKNLIPVKVKMSAANETQLKILGAVILRFSGISSEGDSRQTRQIVYVTDTTDRIYLSREGCIALGLISKDFPTVGEVKTIELGTESSGEECDCPRRQLPPPRPDTIPFPPTTENKVMLKEWLLERYKSSTFNTCEHQLLPMMDVPPLRLMVDKDAPRQLVTKPSLYLFIGETRSKKT